MLRPALLLGLAWGFVWIGAPGAAPVPPGSRPTCLRPVVILQDGAELLACLESTDAVARPGRRYEPSPDGWIDRGPMRGALLAMHGLPVPVNEAAEEDLRALPGVGPTLARRLREARDAAPLCSRADLDRVPGLGPSKAGAIAGAAAFDHPRCGGDRDR